MAKTPPQPQPAAQPQTTATRVEPKLHDAKPLKLDRKFDVAQFLKRWWWLVALIVVFAGAVVYFAYSYFDTRNQLMQIANSEQNAQAAGQQLAKEISKYLELPNETPTLATVSDASKLKSQEFFKNAQNGDQVLVFSQAGRALLYRPSTKKVIEYSKVDFNTAPTH